MELSKFLHETMLSVINEQKENNRQLAEALKDIHEMSTKTHQDLEVTNEALKDIHEMSAKTHQDQANLRDAVLGLRAEVCAALRRGGAAETGEGAGDGTGEGAPDAR